jgi:hypothetical protein
LSNATSRTDLLASHFTAATDWSDPVAINEPVGGMVIGSESAKSPEIATDTHGNATVIWLQNQSASGGLVDTLINRYQPAGSPNLKPVAEAGPLQTVNSGDVATLDGGASSDADGAIVDYQWAQIEGPTVTLSSTNGPSVNFTAPTVTVDTALQFQLTVMDDGYATDRDQVVVGVFPPGGSTDVTPPVTTITTVKNRAKGKTDYDVTLASNEPGLTFFRVTGDGTITSGGENTTDLQEYSGAINIALTKGGNGVTFEYYSRDLAGNEEVIQTEVLQ